MLKVIHLRGWSQDFNPNLPLKLRFSHLTLADQAYITVQCSGNNQATELNTKFCRNKCYYGTKRLDGRERL